MAALPDAVQASGSANAADLPPQLHDTDDVGTCTLPSPSSIGSLPSFCDHQTEYAPVDAMREAIRGMESDIVDLVFHSSSALSATPGRLADWLKVPLECATAGGNLGAVKRLLSAGVGTEPPSNGARPGLLLHTAAGSGNAPVIEAILRDGAKVGEVDRDRHNRTALHVAAGLGREAAVRAIASAPGADFNAVDKRGWTPLHVAANAGHRGVVVFLLLMGAKTTLMTVREGDSPLHLAAASNHAGVIEDLLAVGKVSPGLCNHAGQTALHVAARLHHVGACIALLRGGATIGRVCSQGFSCLDVAAENGHSFQLLQVLTAGESPADRRRRCSLALHYAAKVNKTDTIRSLVALGANINTKRSGGDTSLHYMAKWGKDVATQALLVNGADLEVRNNEGLTPLHMACATSKSSTVRLLLRWGANENAFTYDNATPYELVGSSVEEELLSPEEVVSNVHHIALIRSMLDNVPADRVWRRRGWLVLCRARWLARVASKRQQPRPPTPVPWSGIASNGGGGGSGSGSGGSRGSSSGKAPANKKRKGKGEGEGARGAGEAVKPPSSGGKGKGQAAPRDKEEAGDGGESSSSSSSSGNGGGRKPLDGKRRGVNGWLQLLTSGGSGGVARLGPGTAATLEAAMVMAAGFSAAHQHPELRLGRGSVLSEGDPLPGTAAAAVSAAVGKQAKSNFVGAVERLLLLREEGIFREVLGFL